MNEASLSVILEAIMFTSGRSMSTEELSKTVDKSIDEIKSSLEELQSRIKRRQDSALQLTEVSGDGFSKSVQIFLPSCLNHSVLILLKDSFQRLH